MKRTRVTIDAIVLDGARNAHTAVASLRAQIAEQVRAAVRGSSSARPDGGRRGSIEVALPSQSSDARIGGAVAGVVAGAVRDRKGRA